jgi:hypothetical protein
MSPATAIVRDFDVDAGVALDGGTAVGVRGAAGDDGGE